MFDFNIILSELIDEKGQLTRYIDKNIINTNCKEILNILYKYYYFDDSYILIIKDKINKFTHINLEILYSIIEETNKLYLQHLLIFFKFYIPKEMFFIFNGQYKSSNFSFQDYENICCMDDNIILELLQLPLVLVKKKTSSNISISANSIYHLIIRETDIEFHYLTEIKFKAIPIIFHSDVKSAHAAILIFEDNKISLLDPNYNDYYKDNDLLRMHNILTEYCENLGYQFHMLKLFVFNENNNKYNLKPYFDGYCMAWSLFLCELIQRNNDINWIKNLNLFDKNELIQIYQDYISKRFLL